MFSKLHMYVYDGAVDNEQDPDVAVQVVATKASSHFYSQESVDETVRAAIKPLIASTGGMNEEYGVKVWTDADEWSVCQSAELGILLTPGRIGRKLEIRYYILRWVV